MCHKDATIHQITYVKLFIRVNIVDLAITKPPFLGPVCDLYCEVLPESGSSLSVTFHLSDSDSLSVCEYLLSLLCRGQFSGITIQYVTLHFSTQGLVWCIVVLQCW